MFSLFKLAGLGHLCVNLVEVVIPESKWVLPESIVEVDELVREPSDFRS